MTLKQVFPKDIVVHRSATTLTKDKVKFPFRSTKCKIDDFHYQVVSCHWKEVTCKECLQVQNQPKTLPMPNPKRKEMYLKLNFS